MERATVRSKGKLERDTRELRPQDLQPLNLLYMFILCSQGLSPLPPFLSETLLLASHTVSRVLKKIKIKIKNN